MAKIIGVMLPRKAPSLKGNIVISSWRGIPYIAKWPKKRSRPLPEITQEQNDWFRQANILTKYIEPRFQEVANQAVKGTPLYPRDVEVALMRGTLFGINFGKNQRMFSVANQQAVSESLDVLGQTPGGLLYRNEDRWDLLGPETAGKVLQTNGPSAAPSWVTPGGGSGGLFEKIAELTAPTSNAFDFQGLDLTPYREIQIKFTDLEPNVTDAFFKFKVYRAGVLSSFWYTWSYTAYSSQNVINSTRSTFDTKVELNGSGFNWGVSTPVNQGFSGTLTMANPSTTDNRLVYWIGTHQTPSGWINSYRGAGWITNTLVIDGFRIDEPTNGIVAGQVTIIGIK